MTHSLILAIRPSNCSPQVLQCYKRQMARLIPDGYETHSQSGRAPSAFLVVGLMLIATIAATTTSDDLVHPDRKEVTLRPAAKAS